MEEQEEDEMEVECSLYSDILQRIEGQILLRFQKEFEALVFFFPQRAGESSSSIWVKSW